SIALLPVLRAPAGPVQALAFVVVHQPGVGATAPHRLDGVRRCEDLVPQRVPLQAAVALPGCLVAHTVTSDGSRYRASSAARYTHRDPRSTSTCAGAPHRTHRK